MYGHRLTLQQYKDMMGQLFQHYTMELGDFQNMLIQDDWAAIRYTVKVKNLDTGEEILQNTMEFVNFKENPEPTGVRVVEGWALSDSPLVRQVIRRGREKPSESRVFFRQIPRRKQFVNKSVIEYTAEGGHFHVSNFSGGG